MTFFHRFCSLFPVLTASILMTFALGGCVATSGNQVWNQPRTKAEPSIPAPTPAATIGNFPSQSAVKVAILLPLSGGQSTVGQSMLQAAQLAVFDTGYDNFELMPFDTLGNAQGASAAATAAVSQGAQIILGPLLSEEAKAVKSIVTGQNINMISFSTDWSLAGGNAYVMGFLPFGQVERVAAYAAARGLKNTAVINIPGVYGNAATSAFEQSARRHGLSTARVSSPMPAHDSVFIPAGGQDLMAVLPKLVGHNARKLGTGLWDDTRLAANASMNGAWFAAPSPASRRGFEQRYQSTYGQTPIRIATLAYDATALTAALAKFGASQGRGPAFDHASLTNPAGFAGIDGIMRFNKNGLAERGLAILEINNGRITEIDPAPKRF